MTRREVSLSQRATHVWRYWRVAHAQPQPVPPVPALLESLRGAPSWDVAGIEPVDGRFPRVHIDWHTGYGFVLQCYEDEAAWSDFLVTGLAFSTPSVEVELGGQALERWPIELFVSFEAACEALEHFLATGRENPAQHWVRIDKFPRESLWEGAEEREAWEQTKQGR